MSRTSKIRAWRHVKVGSKVLRLAWIVALGYVAWAFLIGFPRPRVSVSDAPLRGPVVARGRLVGPADRTTPSGQLASAWRSWVELSSPERRLVEDRCAIEEVDGLRLLDERGWLQVSPELLRLPYGGFPSPRGDPALGPHVRRAPDSLASLCPPGALKLGYQPGSSGLFYSNPLYFEVAIPPDAEVAVSACREGDMLRPCGDGGDEIGVNPLDKGFGRGLHSFPENGQLLEWLAWIFSVLGTLTAAWVVYARVSDK